MKTKITSKEIRNYYTKNHIFNANAIENEITFFFGDGDYYNCGVYGWNYNVYDFNSFCVLFGYRSFPACVWMPENIVEYIKNAREEARKLHWTEIEKYQEEVRATFKKMIIEYLNKA